MLFKVYDAFQSSPWIKSHGPSPEYIDFFTEYFPHIFCTVWIDNEYNDDDPNLLIMNIVFEKMWMKIMTQFGLQKILNKVNKIIRYWCEKKQFPSQLKN